MTDEKICHLTLSWTYPGLPCIKETCMAWVPECRLIEWNPKCDPTSCEKEDREYLECKGGCRLI